MNDLLEQQTAPESTRGLFDSPVSTKKSNTLRDSAPVYEKRRSLGTDSLSNVWPPNSHHQRSRSASTSDFRSPNQSGRRSNQFGLQTLLEEDDKNKKKDVNVDSLQEMINTLKNLPPVISSAPGQRKQQTMSTIISPSGGANTNHQVTFHNKRMSYSTYSSQPNDNDAFQNNSNDIYRYKRSQSVSGPSDRDSNMFNQAPRSQALAEAEAKLMGSRDGKLDYLDSKQGYGRASHHMSRRYSESSSSNVRPLNSGFFSERTSFQMPTLNEHEPIGSSIEGVGHKRKIIFNKPLDLAATNSMFEKDYTMDKSYYGSPRRLSLRNTGPHNSDSDWRSSSLSQNTATNRNSFHFVPFTPTRVNFSRDDANPHQRRPLFIAHLPFSALTPLFRDRELFQGILRVNKRNRSDAYVFCDELDSDVYICGSRDRNRALEGDVVAVRLAGVDKVLSEKNEKEEAKLARNGGQPKFRLPDEEDENEIIFGGDEDVKIVRPKYCGIVVAILERAQNQVFSGTLTLMRPNNKRAQEEEAKKLLDGYDASKQQKEGPRIVWFKASDKRVPLIAIPIEQAPNDFIENNQEYAKRLFVGTTKRWPITSLHPFGSLEEEIGSVHELKTQIKAILADNNVTNSEFSEAVQSCMPPLSFDCGQDTNQSRRDLRGFTNCLTIDPKGSNVLDDALSIETIDESSWRVGVHISDLTYFIKSQTPLDKEARARGVRVDLANTHVPMVPEVLTNQITNLSPNKSRFTFSVIWKINKNGEIVNTWFGKTVIKSSAQFSYEEAQSVIDNGSDSDDQTSKDIKLLYRVASLLHSKRKEKGVFSQMRDQLEFEMRGGKYGEVSSFSTAQKIPASIIVKELLLLANLSVAHKIAKKFPDQALLRRHASPDPRKIYELCSYASSYLGVKLDATNAGSLQSSIESIKDFKLRKMVSVLALKTFQTPKYFCSGSVDTAKLSHYALNAPLFTHFTAPSRRFADIVVHRQLEAALSPEEDHFSLESDIVQKIAQHCNVKKDAAICAAEQSTLTLLSFHLHKQAQSLNGSADDSGLSATFREAVIVAVFENYFDVIMPELNIERRIHLACLPVWRSDYNQTKQTLTMFWRKGVNTSTGEKMDWNYDDDEDDMDEEALLEEMNDISPTKIASAPLSEIGEDEEDQSLEDQSNYTHNVNGKLSKHMMSPSIVLNKSASTPIIRRASTSKSNNKRASIVHARLSDSTAYNTEQGYQTIKALDKIQAVMTIDMARTPPNIRVLAVNPFS
ncbi:hypothetical protein BY458DRAFT_560110 [Sporodiniella umbellata]|nr:hypothetical protein BY458DRAFT_560110 [Sporodiniella umbellata]